MRSAICCCAASNAGRRGWTCRTIPTFPWPRCAPRTPQLLLEHHLKELRLPTILREYDKVARQCAAEQVDYPRYLLRMTELELLDRERRATERRIRQAKFPVVKTMDSFDFLAMPSLNSKRGHKAVWRVGLREVHSF